MHNQTTGGLVRIRNAYSAYIQLDVMEFSSCYLCAIYAFSCPALSSMKLTFRLKNVYLAQRERFF